jgi:N-acetylglucosamine-6-phosphate deacetylase
MDAAVRNVVALGIPLEEALGAAATVPARLAGREGTVRGVVVLDDRLEVVRTIR